MTIRQLWHRNVNVNGAAAFRAFFLTFALGGVIGTIGQLVLYLRPTPLGQPFVLDVPHYLPHAIFYQWYGMALLALPFFCLAPFVKGRALKASVGLHWTFTTLSLLVDVIHAELQRHMGIRFTLDWLATYSSTQHIPQSIWRTFANDDGGPYSSLLMLGLPLLYLGVGPLLYRKMQSVRLSGPWKTVLVIVVVIVCYFLPFLMRTSLFGSKNRQFKVAPPVLVIRDEILEQLKPAKVFTGIAQHRRVVQQKWQVANMKPWQFADTDFPLQKSSAAVCDAPEQQWNVILIVLETFRAMNIKLYNNEALVQATPFLAKMATSPNGAYWQRFISNSQPTVYSFMAIHTSLLPHSSQTVARAFATTPLPSLPSILNQNGYHTLFFAGSDPDWDNQRAWLNRWYNESYYNPDDGEQDRRVFRYAARRIAKVAITQTPFMATLFSISNHIPFDSPEPVMNLFDANDELPKKIYNTMHYTDDVVREFIESIENAPWFKDTIVIVTGDHGYDLGERGTEGGHTNIRHETDWVPLIMYSKHPLQPQGMQQTVGSHVDVAPTVLDMLGICAPNGFVGHSLFGVKPEEAYAINLKSGNMGVETATHSFYFSSQGDSFAYDGSDLLQKANIIGGVREEAKRVFTWAQSFSEVTDYLYEKQRASLASKK
ncbi:MAG: LTA synthase family protein [Deltaproteobacteria bacterium]|nr:LTA synthase family protein [Deltaproteobacteria bacterium]